MILRRTYVSNKIEVIVPPNYLLMTLSGEQSTMEFLAREDADEIGTNVQTDTDGHLHVIKTVNHHAEGYEYWLE